MGQRRRFDGPGVRHHVINRGLGKRLMVAGRQDRRSFLSQLARASRREELEVESYSLLRPADAAVVFGAAVRANGAPSQSFRDRTLTACDRCHRGLVHTLVLSGGRDPKAPLSEPACMAQIARAAGVPDSALVLDEQGTTTDASVRNVRRLCQERG